MELNIEGFTAHLQLKDTRNITIQRHIRCLKLVYNETKEFTSEGLKAHLDGKKLLGTSNMTLRNYVSTLRLYAGFLGVDFKLSLKNYPRVTSGIRRVFSDEQIEAFLSVPKRTWMNEKRHQMFVVFWALCAYCAFRPGEAARLKKTDVDLANKQITLRAEITKTNQFSTLPIFPNIFSLVEKYIKNLKTDYLFPSKHKGKYNNGNEEVIDQRDWGWDFDARLKQAEIEKVPGLVPYSLRHSCATRWISGDMSIYKVRRLMRHVKLEQTLTYEHMTSGHLVQDAMKHDSLMRKFADPSDILEVAEDNLDDFGIMKDERFSDDFKRKLKELFLEERLRVKKI